MSLKIAEKHKHKMTAIVGNGLYFCQNGQYKNSWLKNRIKTEWETPKYTQLQGGRTFETGISV